MAAFHKDTGKGFSAVPEGMRCGILEMIHIQTHMHSNSLPTHSLPARTQRPASAHIQAVCSRWRPSIKSVHLFGSPMLPYCNARSLPGTMRPFVAVVDLAMNVNEPQWWETKWHSYIKAPVVQRGQLGFYFGHQIRCTVAMLGVWPAWQTRLPKHSLFIPWAATRWSYDRHWKPDFKNSWACSNLSDRNASWFISYLCVCVFK